MTIAVKRRFCVNDMAGEPDLRDPEWRCVECTEKNGLPPSNCANNYQGVIEKIPKDSP